jgi:hypothetical protein
MAVNSDWKERLKNFMVKYSTDMANENTFDAEIDLWENMWLSGSKHISPEKIVETIEKMPTSMYPNIYKVLHLLAVLPVTTCECERSISTLRRVKTYLRNSMAQVGLYIV